MENQQFFAFIFGKYSTEFTSPKQRYWRKREGERYITLCVIFPRQSKQVAENSGKNKSMFLLKLISKMHIKNAVIAVGGLKLWP